MVVYADKYWNNVSLWRSIRMDSNKTYKTKASFGRPTHSYVFHRVEALSENIVFASPRDSHIHHSPWPWAASTFGHTLKKWQV
nr:hypothetical protein [Tanacetum cinerariifolium]